MREGYNAATYFVDRHVNEGRGDRVAIECGDRRVTYRELLEGVNRVGNGLRKLGVRMEERVPLLLLDTPEFAMSFFGAIKIGAVPVPLNALLMHGDYEYMLNDTRARVLIVSEALRTKLSPIPKKNLRYLEHVLVVPESGFMVGESPVLEAADTDRDDVALWLYSSGSTGAPKACVHLQHDMAVTAERYGKGALGITADDRFFSVSKSFFSYGLGNSVYLPFSVGATSILMPGAPKAEAVFEVIERHRPTLFFSVPSNYAALLAHSRKTNERDYDLSSIRAATSAGEQLPVPLFERFKERFKIELLDHIGSSEGFAFITNRPGRVRPGSSGELVPGYGAQIVDEHDRPVPAGEAGDLLIETDAMFAYYWNQHEKTKNTVLGTWLRTGDKCRRDADGYFWYIGRSDDMLRCSGVWVNPAEVERVLVEHPAVLEAGVAGKKDADGLTKPTAYVVLCDGFAGGDALGSELQEFVKERLPVYMRPRWVSFVAALPRTASGKLQRFKLGIL